MINRFSPKETAVLKALGQYKYLTYDQMMRLGIDNHRSNLSTLLKGLRDSKRPYVKKIPHRIGNEVKHYLSKKGVQVLIELYDLDPETIHYPKGTVLTDTQDQKHRTSIISIQIELSLTCLKYEVPLLVCDRYFDTTGNNRIDRNLKSKTALHYTDRKTVKADLIFSLQTPKQEEFYVLELENGKETQKGVDKCINHAKCILRGSLNEKYGYELGYRTLWIFEYESIMHKTIERLQQLSFFDNFHEYFLFKSIEGLAENFLSGWTNISGHRRDLFYID